MYSVGYEEKRPVRLCFFYNTPRDNDFTARIYQKKQKNTKDGIENCERPPKII
jgi:hypothetical protein